ncbi:uncharacterized protein LOC128253845 [Drosophila gunungcola]|uniref:Uncharacterized protein n=1 Tax=Drosophila gunungcola TaxID=103775 RepID=A0A9P9YNP8_9MUSC|nr:uncharacterized protein LOC128253845 [Drosophila gunungcola]KAI8040080.1 hypothetical protein M5D96_007508 [Drosophila gunungcola]
MDYKRILFFFSIAAALLLCNFVRADETETEVIEEDPQLLEAGETAQGDSGDESVRKVRQYFGPPPFGPPPPPFFGPPPPPYYGGGFSGGFGGGFQRTRVVTRTRYRGRGGYYGGGFYG